METNQETPKHKIMTAQEVSAYLRLPLSTIYELAAKGKLNGVKFGRQWRFLQEDLLAYFRKRSMKFTALMIAFFFTVSNVTWAQPVMPSLAERRPHTQRIHPDSVTIPAELGTIQETYVASAESPTVILIQDAHAIPDAQRNIQQLINYFQQEHGVDLVALEGAASPLDPTLFKSFPDKKVLREVFQKYYEDGELTGGTAAAIFNDA